MALYVPNDTGSVSPGRGATQSTDTYVRPAMPTADDSLNQLAHSLGKLGVTFDNIADDRARAKEKEDIANVEHTRVISGELKDGIPVMTQLQQMHPEKSYTALALVAQNMGEEQALKDANEATERLSHLPNVLDPAAYDAEIEKIRAEKYNSELIRGNAGYGSGYIKQFDNFINRTRGQASAERAKIILEEQGKLFDRGVLDKSDTAASSGSSGPTPEGAEAIDGFLNQMYKVESGGNPTARNPKSSAGGIAQFIDSTWVKTVRKHGPDEYKVASAGDIIPLKTSSAPKDVQLQKDMARKFTEDNAKKLTELGVPVTKANLYLMHFAGEGDAPKILAASDGTMASQVMDPASIKANPFLANMTVGQVKEWSAKKMGDTYDPTKAAQNAIRGHDQQWGQMGSVAQVARRDRIAETLHDTALSKADPSYLDRMPPELVTPEIRNKFDEAKRKITAIQWTDAQHKEQLKNQAEKAEFQQFQGEIDQDILAGRVPDARKYVKNHDAFAYALQARNNDLLVNPVDSQIATNSLGRAVESAAFTNDYSAITGNPAHKGTTPPMDELEKAIRDRKDMKLKDKLEMIGKLPALVNSAIIVNSDEAKEHFGILSSTIRDMQNTIMAKAQGLMEVPDFMGTAKTVYDNELRTRIRAHIEDNAGKMPMGEAKRQIFVESLKAAKEAVNEKLKSGPLGDMGGTSKPEAKPAATKAGAPEMETGPDGVRRPRPGSTVAAPASPHTISGQELAKQVGTMIGEALRNPQQ